MIGPEIENVQKYKMIFIGDQGTGKSCILNRYVNNQFEEAYQATIGLDFQSKIITIDGVDIRLLLYDTAGQEKFKALIPMYVRDANIVVFVYDITRPESFASISSWFSLVLEIQMKEALYVLVGNKTDLIDSKKVDTKEGKKFSEEKGMIFAEVSAKTGEGFTELFEEKLNEAFCLKFKPKEKEEAMMQIKNAEEVSKNLKIEESSKGVDVTNKKKEKCC